MAEGEKEAVKANSRRCPKCGALIDHLRYRERAINSGEYRVDGFHNVIASDVDEYYLLCPECGKILFDDIEVADKLLRGQPITEGEIYPEDE
jgi:ribosomal protein S27AE